MMKLSITSGDLLFIHKISIFLQLAVVTELNVLISLSGKCTLAFLYIYIKFMC